VGTPNWGKLFLEGRCKDIGVPWTEEEAVAVRVLGIPVEYVREGCLTVEEYESRKGEVESETEDLGHTPFEYMKKPELLDYAKNLGLKGLQNASKDAIIREIKQKEKKDKKKVEETPAPPPSDEASDTPSDGDNVTPNQ
jgi:hypothetical protein